MSQVVQDPPEHVRVLAETAESLPADDPIAKQVLLITRSNSSDPHLGQLAATSSSFFNTRISKHSLQEEHLNS